MSIREKVSLKVKLNFSLGSFANGFLNGFVFGNIQFYYIEKLGADLRLIGIAWLIFGIWNTLNDPIVSYIEDNTRTKIGRRIPYIRYGSIIYGLTFIFCWFPIAQVGDTWGLFWNFLAALFLLDTMFTIVGCCFYALPNEIAVTAKERASLSVYSSIFGLVNTVIGIVLPVIFLTGQPGVHPLFHPVMVGMAILCSLLLFVTSYGIKENLFAQMQPHEGFWEGIKTTFKNKPFWIFAITAFIGTMILPIFSSGLLYYIDYVVADQDITGILIAFLVGLFAGLLFSPKIVGKLFPKKTLIATMLLVALGAFALFFIGRNSFAAIVPYLLIGFGFVGVSIALSVVTGDVIDNDELITGKRREAIYGGVNAIVTKPAISIANWLFLLTIKSFGYQEPVEQGGELIPQIQDSRAITGILFALGIIPAVGLLIAAFSLRWFPLDGPQWREKKKHLFESHLEKERQYLESLSHQKEI